MRYLPLLAIFALAPNARAARDLHCSLAQGETSRYDTLEIRHVPSLTLDAEVTLYAGTEKTLAHGSYHLVGGHGMVDTYRYSLNSDAEPRYFNLKVAYIPFTPITATLLVPQEQHVEFHCVVAE